MAKVAQKVAIITGSDGGIGSAIVTAYRDLGYAVVATSRYLEQASFVTGEILHVDGGQNAGR